MKLKNIFLLFLVFSILFSFTVSAIDYPLISSRNLVTSSDGTYAFMNQNDFFDVYFGSDPSSGNVVKFTRDGVEMTLLPMALNWNNDLSQLEQISMPQSVSPYISSSTISYNNAYGTGIDLIYEVQPNQVKENIFIFSLGSLPTPAQYVMDGGNPQLEVGFQLSTNAQHIELNGVDWDKSSEISTTNDVIVKNSQGDILYTLPRPYAVDSSGDIQYGKYVFKKSANKLYVRLYIPYSWLQTANYPVAIDPTFTVDYSPIPAEHLQGGINHNETDITFENIEDITSGVSDLNDATNYVTRGETLISAQTNFNLVQDDLTRNSQDKFENLDVGKQFNLPNPSLIDTIEVCYHARTRFLAPITQPVYIRIGNTQTTVALPHTTKDLWGDTCVDITSQKGTLVTGNNIIGMTQPIDGNDWEFGIDTDAPDIGSFKSALPLGTWVAEPEDYMIRVNYVLIDPLLTWSSYNENGWTFIDESAIDWTDEVLSPLDALTTGNQLLQWVAVKYVDLHIDDGLLQNGDVINFRVRTVQATDYGKEVELSNHLNTIEYGNFLMPSQTATFEYRNVTITNAGAGIDHVVIHDSIATANIRADFDWIHPNYDHVDVNGGIGISAHWNVVDDGISSYWLRLKKETSDPANVYVVPYSGVLHDIVEPQLYVEQAVAGTGWINIPVDDIIDYQTNTENYNFTNLRFWTDDAIYWSEVYLRKETTDNELPTITDCTTNTTTLSCLETAFIQCNVTDNLDVADVNFTIDGVLYDPIMNGDFWQFEFAPIYDGVKVYDWTDVSAEDIFGQDASYDPNIQINYTCNFDDYINITHTGTEFVDQYNITQTSAVIYWTTNNPSDSLVDYGTSPSVYTDSEYVAGNVLNHYVPLTGLTANTTYYYKLTSSFNPNQSLAEFNFTTEVGCVWVEDTPVCGINDSYFSTYTETQGCSEPYDPPVPATNGTYQYCNYCSEDLVAFYGECSSNATKTVQYFDNNFFSCCAVTGLSSDCSVTELYPFNETTYDSCFYFNNTMSDIDCQNEPNFNLREKEYCLAYIPNEYLNESFKCISHITQLGTGEVIQTNPEYRERAQSFLGMWGYDPESRDYFSPANAIVNFYYTAKNLNPEYDYILSVECSSQQRTLSSSMNFQMAYEDFQFVFFRTKWYLSNAPYIIGGLLISLIILLVLFGWWRSAR